MRSIADDSVYRVAPDTELDLAEFDPRATPAHPGLDKDEGRERTDELNARLEALQEKFYADRSNRLLVVLQAMDAGGKDGTIRHVFDGVNPQGVKVASFKRPTEVELAHDYLWRVHQHVPADGEITIFNRSHYEDVLVVAVNGWIDDDTHVRRYGHINDFERMLADEGTTILKFFLHISKEEQRERFQSRLDEPHKRWKFSTGDLEVRKQWDAYQRAFEQAISATSTAHAPWFVVPSDRKWYRNLVISETLVGTLESLDLQWPDPEEDLDRVVVV